MTRLSAIKKQAEKDARRIIAKVRKSVECSVPRCHEAIKYKGMCERHYRRQYRNGHVGRKKDRNWKERVKSSHQRRQERVKQRIEEACALDIQTARVFQPLLNPRRYKGARGGRGSGKSHFFAELLVEACVLDPRTRAVCIREVQQSLQESSKRLIEDKIEAFGVQRHFEIQHDKIYVLDRAGRRAGIIIFMGMQNHTATSIKSLEGYNIAWVEEAQNISEASLRLLKPTIRAARSELWFSWNPVSPKDAVEMLFEENKADKDFICIDANYWDNPWFPDELEAEMLRDKRRDIDRYLHIWEGEYQKNSSARVFKNWRIGKREEFETPEFLQLVPRYGADWGYANDPNVAIKVRTDEKRKILYIEREVHAFHTRIENIPDLFDTLDEGEMREWPARADSARPETIDYVARHGYPKLRAAVKGPNSVKEGVEFIKTYDVVIHPDCSHTEDEFMYYSYKVDKKTEEVLPVLADDKNHVIDSVRYAIEPIRGHGKRVGALFRNGTPTDRRDESKQTRRQTRIARRRRFFARAA